MELVVLVVMGVSGAGKTTLAQALAQRLGWPFQEGDALHPAANVAKMAAGTPLGDADRWPWLDAVGGWIDGCVAEGRNGVITCSALKRAYRKRLAHGRREVRFVFIQLAAEVIAGRLAHREDHFMPPSLLTSQFDALEPPGVDEPVIVVDGELPQAGQVGAVLGQLGVFEFPSPLAGEGVGGADG